MNEERVQSNEIFALDRPTFRLLNTDLEQSSSLQSISRIRSIRLKVDRFLESHVFTDSCRLIDRSNRL